MNSLFSNGMSKLKERVARISMRRSYLSGLIIIGILAGGGAFGWAAYNRQCKGQGPVACILDALNPIPKSYGRGAGVPMICGLDEEQDGALCYPKCDAGYNGVGPVCWQTSCPSGYRDDGLFCAKTIENLTQGCPNGMVDIGVSCTKNSYGRTAGVPLHACAENYEKGEADLVCYPKCDAGYHGVGPVCWED